MIDAIHALILILVTFLVTEGVKALAAQTGKDISGSASAIIASLAGLIVFIVDPLLAQIPAGYAPIIVQVLDLVLVIFSAFGLHRTAVRFGGRLVLKG